MAEELCPRTGAVHLAISVLSLSCDSADGKRSNPCRHCVRLWITGEFVVRKQPTSRGNRAGVRSTLSSVHLDVLVDELEGSRQWVNRAAGLLALRDVVEAYGGFGMVAAQAGISREALYRSLSPKENPTLKTLLAVLKSVGMRLSVELDGYAHE